MYLYRGTINDNNQFSRKTYKKVFNVTVFNQTCHFINSGLIKNLRMYCKKNMAR